MAQVPMDYSENFPPPKPLVISSISVVPLHRQEGFLRKKYELEGLSIHQISAQTFSSRSVISKQMKEFGIPLRSAKEQLQFNKGQIAYGERILKAGVTSKKNELAILELMLMLRSQGHSYWKIAAELSRRGIPTKNGKTIWKAATVMKICKRVSS